MADSFKEALSRSLSGSHILIRFFFCFIFFLGVMGGLISTTVMHPVDLVQKRIQVQEKKNVPVKDRYRGIVDALIKTAEQNGILGLYEGMHVSYLSNISKNSVFFSVYETLKFSNKKMTEAELGALRQIVFGMMSGMLAMCFTNPIQVIQTQQNIHSNSGSRLSAVDAYRQVVRQKGFRGLYAGITPGLVLSIYPALQNLIFDRLKAWFLTNVEGDEDKKLPPFQSFFFGLTANIVTLVFCYPLIFLKVRVQAQNVAKEHHLGTIQMAQKVVSKDGFLGLWKGMQSQISNATVSSAIMFMSKEQLQNLFKWLLDLGNVKRNRDSKKTTSTSNI